MPLFTDWRKMPISPLAAAVTLARFFHELARWMDGIAIGTSNSTWFHLADALRDCARRLEAQQREAQEADGGRGVADEEERPGEIGERHGVTGRRTNRAP